MSDSPLNSAQVDRVEVLLDRAEKRVVELHLIVLDRFDDELTVDERREARRIARLAKRDLTTARRVMADA